MPHHAAAITFQITRRCQLSCLHCISRTQDRAIDLPLSLFDHILDQTANYDLDNVSFGGGEATIHPQFPEMVESVSRRGINFFMVTNGQAFPKISHVLKDCRRNLGRVTFSLDGARQETNDYIRGTGTYQRVMEAIEICHRDELPFGITMVVTAANQSEVSELLSLGERLGAEQMWITAMQPTPEAARRGLDLPPQRYVEIGAEAGRMASAFRAGVLTSEGSHAPAGWFLCGCLNQQLFTVDPRGNLGICGYLIERAGGAPGTEIAGNLAEMSFHEAHRRLMRLADGVKEARIAALEAGTLDTLEHTFPCWFCVKHFRKVDWIQDFADHPWGAGAQSEELSGHLR